MRRAAKKIDTKLAQWGLDDLVQGRLVTLFHGTTRMFKTFDLGKSRHELVNKFYGNGIFLVPSKRTAEKYALANRNIGFDPEIVDDLKSKNLAAGKFMEKLVKRGDSAWNDMTPEKLGVRPENFMTTLIRMVGGVDPNTIADVAAYVVGTKVRRLEEDGESYATLNIFNTSTGLPEYMYKNLDKIGLNSEVYRPKVYRVEVQANNVLVTTSKSQAKNARTKGYDGVVFFGSDLVDNVPEVVVFSPKNARVKGYEVV